MKEAPSQLPADILTSAREIDKITERLGNLLRSLRACETGEEAHAVLGDAMLEQMNLRAESQRLLAWIKVGQLPQIAAVAPMPARGMQPALPLFIGKDAAAGERVYHGEKES